MNKAINRTTVQVESNKYRVYPKAAPLFYKKADGSYGDIDHTFYDTTSSIGDISLMDKGVVSVGKRKGNNPHKVVGIRPDNNQHLGTQQLEFSLVNVELDGESEDFNVEDDLEIKLRASKVFQLVKINKDFNNFKIEFDIHSKGLELKNTKYTEATTIRDYGFNLTDLGENTGNSIISNHTNYNALNKEIPFIDCLVGKITDDYITVGEYTNEEEFGDSDLSFYTLNNNFYPNGSSIHYKDCIVLVAQAYNTDDVENIFVSKLCNEYALETIWENNKNGKYFTKNGKKIGGYYSINQMFYMFINTKEIEDSIKELFKRKTFNNTSYLDITLSDFKTTLNKLFNVNLKLDLDTNYYKPINNIFEFKVNNNSFYIKEPIIFDKDYNYLNLSTTHSLKDNQDGSYRYTKYFSANGFLSNTYNIKYIDATLAAGTSEDAQYSYRFPTSGTSSGNKKTSTNLATVRNASTGTAANTSTSDTSMIKACGDNSRKEGGGQTAITYSWENWQTHIVFDSSEITGTVSDLDLKVKGGRRNQPSTLGVNIIILKSNIDGTNVTSNWNDITGHTSSWGASDVTEYSSSIAIGNLYASPTFQTMELNSDARTDLENLSTFKIAFAEYDQYYSGTLQTSYGVGTTEHRQYEIKQVDDTDTTERPYLEYTAEEGEEEESVTYNANFFGANF